MAQARTSLIGFWVNAWALRGQRSYCVMRMESVLVEETWKRGGPEGDERERERDACQDPEILRRQSKDTEPGMARDEGQTCRLPRNSATQRTIPAGPAWDCPPEGQRARPHPEA